MEKILTLTDFSPLSDHAVETAMQLAQLYNSELTIFHDLTKEVDITVEFGSKPEITFIAEGKNDAFKNLEYWNERSQILEVHTQFIVSSEDFLTKTAEIVESLKPDLIVMGSAGAGGKKEFIWGSNTQKIVESVDCPVLVVKDLMQDYQLDNIIFASSFDEKEQESFKYFLDLLKLPKSAHIHLVFVNTLGYFNEPSQAIKESMLKFKALAKGLKTSQHYYKDYSVDAGLRNIMDELKPDMLVMTNKYQSPIKHFFQGSDVNRMINHSIYPVLVIDYKG